MQVVILFFVLTIICLGDYSVRVKHTAGGFFQQGNVLVNDAMSPLFMAAIEATEEAILNSLFIAETIKGKNGVVVDALPIGKVMQLMKDYKSLK